jgi:hypothetical protein
MYRIRKPHAVVIAREPAQLLRRIEVAVLAPGPAGAKVLAVHRDDGVAAGYREGWDRRAGLPLDARAHVLRGGDVEAGEDEDEEQRGPRTQACPGPPSPFLAELTTVLF